MSTNRYLQAARRIPPGETRTFLELAALAGRPGAARAAGRALAACDGRGDVPWHRVVAADGSLAKDTARARRQLTWLRQEGGRPREGESVIEWALRRRVHLVGHLPSRQFVPVDDLEGLPWKAHQVEAIRDEATALSRGLLPRDRPPYPDSCSMVRRRRTDGVRRATPSMASRLAGIDWSLAREALARTGVFHHAGLLSGLECDAVLTSWDRPARFERSIAMGPKGYGIGSYRYFREPLPSPLGALRRRLYRELRPLADDLRPRPPGEPGFPATLSAFWEQCREAGQERASSILIRYGTGGINHPHRDLYGREWFPLQALVVLSRRGRDFEGGEFALLEEGRGGEETWRVVPADLGDLVIFGSRHRWETAGRRRRKVPLRHAMRIIRRGERFGAGIVLNLAQ